MPYERYTNPGFAKAGVAVYRNVFVLVADIDDYEGETYLQTKRATYAEIRAWVKRNYGLHVSNLTISWTKDRCGFAKTRPKEGRGPEGTYAGEGSRDPRGVHPIRPDRKMNKL